MIIDTKNSKNARVNFFDINEVTLTEGFWNNKLAMADNAVKHILELFESDRFNVVNNFLVAANLKEGRHRGTPYGDGDFYKLLEAASYVAKKNDDTELLNTINKYIDLIIKVQKPDGYISTKQIIAENKGINARLGDINDFEVYNFGHLFTFACVYKRLFSSNILIGVAHKAANYLNILYDKYLNEGVSQTEVCPSHYMGICELYRTTRDEFYLELLKKAIKVRDLVPEGTDDNQDSIPLKEHRKITGHSVRSTYLYAGVTDLLLEEDNKELKEVVEACYKNLVDKKLYINGGCGAIYYGVSPYGMFPGAEGTKVYNIHQAFGYEYQLPNITAYNETCATIGNILWNFRMYALYLEPKYMDLIESSMYNLVLASTNLDGTKYFYENMLRRPKNLDFKIMWPNYRSDNLSCFCCPPNMARTIAETSEYLFSKTNDEVILGMYGASTCKVELENGSKFLLMEETNYPYDGKIKVKIDKLSEKIGFKLKVRIPAWVNEGSITYNGNVYNIENNYESYFYDVEIFDLENNEVLIDFVMKPRFILPNNMIEETSNMIALMRGPILYCAESCDNDAEELLDLLVATDSDILEKEIRINNEKVIQLELKAKELVKKQNGNLYNDIHQIKLVDKKIKLVPYYTWDNRKNGEMSVWLKALWR